MYQRKNTSNPVIHHTPLVAACPLGKFNLKLIPGALVVLFNGLGLWVTEVALHTDRFSSNLQANLNKLLCSANFFFPRIWRQTQRHEVVYERTSCRTNTSKKDQIRRPNESESEKERKSTSRNKEGEGTTDKAGHAPAPIGTRNSPQVCISCVIHIPGASYFCIWLAAGLVVHVYCQSCTCAA